MKKFIIKISCFICTSLLLILEVATITGCSCSNEKGTAANATELTTSYDDTKNNTSDEQETTNIDESVSTSSLPDGMAYELDDGTYIEIDKLLAPMNALNNICTGISSINHLGNVYPDEVATKLAEYNKFDSVDEYVDFLYTTYAQMYGEQFTFSNEYLSCTPLDAKELTAMTEFYKEHFLTDIIPEYAFIVESEFSVTYIDEEGNEQTDRTPDYYIAYYYNESIYLDYLYVDTLDL